MDGERKNKQLKSTKIEINKLRSQITQVVEQHSLVQQSMNRLHTAVISEESRIDICQTEYDTLSKTFDQMIKNSAATEESKDDGRDEGKDDGRDEGKE